MPERNNGPPLDVEHDFIEFLTRSKLLSYQQALEEEGMQYYITSDF